MVTITGPAVVIIATIGYIGINTIVNGIGKMLNKGKERNKDKT